MELRFFVVYDRFSSGNRWRVVDSLELTTINGWEALENARRDAKSLNEMYGFPTRDDNDSRLSSEELVERAIIERAEAIEQHEDEPV